MAFLVDKIAGVVFAVFLPGFIEPDIGVKVAGIYGRREFQANRLAVLIAGQRSIRNHEPPLHSILALAGFCRNLVAQNVEIRICRQAALFPVLFDFHIQNRLLMELVPDFPEVTVDFQRDPLFPAEGKSHVYQPPGHVTSSLS